MSKKTHNSKILKVYQQCQKMLNLKRQFIESIYIPIFSYQKQSSKSLKQYCSAYYIKYVIIKFFKQSSQIYSIYTSSTRNKKFFLQQIQNNIKKIINTKQLTSKHQQLQIELQQLKKKWQSQDPLIYYQINERTKIKTQFVEKLLLYKQCQSGMRTISNPHFLHQLINQLKQNLQKISTQDKLFDKQTQENTHKISKFLNDLTAEMQNNINDIHCRSFVFQVKKTLFSQFIELQDMRGSRKINLLVQSYFQQLIRASEKVKDYFKRLITFVDSLVIFFKDIQIILQLQIKKTDAKYQSFMEDVFKNKQIGIILQTDMQQRISNNLKAFFSICEILKPLPQWFTSYKRQLLQCYSQASMYHERYLAKQVKSISSDIFQKMLIQHRGYFTSLQKKQQKYNRLHIQTLKTILLKLHQHMLLIHRQNVKSAKLRKQTNVHQFLNRIFKEYDFKDQKEQTKSTSSGQQDQNVKKKIKEYQEFVSRFHVFDYNTINWNNPYYQCSLGTKLLIHGSLQSLQQGIYYQSSFNKKNYFFGRCRMFIPKKDIYQINKQIFWLIFPDVIQVRTNKGSIIFHALGKRDRMYEQFINYYFPEVQEINQGDQLEFQFNQYKGDLVRDNEKFKIVSYPIDLGMAVLKNTDLRVIFRRYFSDDPFTYQGTQYKNFKTYALQIVDTIKPQTNQLTPPAPYYFAKKGETTFSESVPEYSVRLAKFYKKIPMIPFVSKGGQALCQQTTTYYWCSPTLFSIQISSIMKGFSMTQGMTIKMRAFYQQLPTQIQCKMTGDVVFQKQGALNGTIKGQALHQFKQVIRKTNQAILKNQKNRSIYKNKGNRVKEQEKDGDGDQIQRLKGQNALLRRRIKILVVVFLIAYFCTVIFFQWDSMCGTQKDQTVIKKPIKVKQTSFFDYFF